MTNAAEVDPPDDEEDEPTLIELYLNGVLLHTTLKVVPFGSKYERNSPEWEAALEAKRQDILARRPPGVRWDDDPDDEAVEASEAAPVPSYNCCKPALPYDMEWDDLKCVSCCRCGRTLLSESQEYLRAVKAPGSYRLPAKVAGRIRRYENHLSPVCSACLPRRTP
jgi:hypothetical protein